MNEKEKYTKIWNNEDYRKFSPAEHFCQLMPEVSPGRLIDFGTGCGRQALKFHDKGFDVTLIDLAENCLDPEPKEKLADKLLIQNVWDPVPAPPYDYAICCDVMEHLPTEYVALTLKNIVGSAAYCFFSICNTPDHFGQAIGHPLHLTVKPFMWWRDLISEFATIENGRDLFNDSVFWVKSK